MAKRVVIAVGGNVILQPHQAPTFEAQLRNVQVTAAQIAKVEAMDYEIVLTHGNGPQVGNVLQQNDIAKDVVPPFPLDACNSETQGSIGYMLEQSLKNALNRQKSSANVVTFLTQVKVDPAFKKPTKPVGVFYSEEEAKKLQVDKGWDMVEDAGRGWRRVVPSPSPLRIHGVDAIVHLLEQNMMVVAGGGGGIPVYQNSQGEIEGLEAVIDKDRTGCKLAQQVDADVFMILTASATSASTTVHQTKRPSSPLALMKRNNTWTKANLRPAACARRWNRRSPLLRAVRPPSSVLYTKPTSPCGERPAPRSACIINC